MKRQRKSGALDVWQVAGGTFRDTDVQYQRTFLCTGSGAAPRRSGCDKNKISTLVKESFNGHGLLMSPQVVLVRCTTAAIVIVCDSIIEFLPQVSKNNLSVQFRCGKDGGRRMNV